MSDIEEDVLVKNSPVVKAKTLSECIDNMNRFQLTRDKIKETLMAAIKEETGDSEEIDEQTLIAVYKEGVDEPEYIKMHDLVNEVMVLAVKHHMECKVEDDIKDMLLKMPKVKHDGEKCGWIISDKNKEEVKAMIESMPTDKVLDMVDKARKNLKTEEPKAPTSEDITALAEKVMAKVKAKSDSIEDEADKHTPYFDILPKEALEGEGLEKTHGEKGYEMVNHPTHYNQYDMEVIDMMQCIWGTEATIKWCEMTAFKYRMRMGTKPGNDIQQDLKKEQWYLDKAKELKEK